MPSLPDGIPVSPAFVPMTSPPLPLSRSGGEWIPTHQWMAEHGRKETNDA